MEALHGPVTDRKEQISAPPNENRAYSKKCSLIHSHTAIQLKLFNLILLVAVLLVVLLLWELVVLRSILQQNTKV